jgi:oligosaccharide repeat unit polymerase
MSYGPFDRLALIPYLYFELCFLISLYPIYKFDVNCLKNIRVNAILLNILICVVAIAAILPFFENLIYFIDVYILHPDINTLYNMYVDKVAVGIDKYDLTNWISPVGRICNSITLKFQPIVLLSLFYCLTRKKINKFSVTGLLVILSNISLFTVLLSGRGTVVFFFIFFIFFCLLFRNILSKKLLKQVATVSFVIVGSMTVAMVILSMARFEGHGVNEHHGIVEWISMYLGGALVDFNDSMWNISQYTEGDRSFSFFKDLMGFTTYTEYPEFRLYWHSAKTNVLPHRFYTYIGDWYSDLGPWFTLLLTTVLSLAVRKITSKRKSISFVSLYVYLSFCYIIINGWSIYPYLTGKSTLGIILCLIVCFVLSVNINKIKHV